ncbi:MAG: hypothetical protein N2C14_32935, partial [Planctomycetales bacterium]
WSFFKSPPPSDSTAKPPPATARFLTGRVVLEGRPVPKARVRFPGRADFELTKADGTFQIAVPSNKPHRITAWKEGCLIGGSLATDEPLSIKLTRLPDRDFKDYAWVDPTPNPEGEHNCGNCHPEIHDQWRSSAHARSASNPRFLNLLDGTDRHGEPDSGWNLLKDHPHGAGVCVACHAPTVAFDDPAYQDLRKAGGVDAHGVHCDYCHKIQSASVADVGKTHGRFGLGLLRPEEGQLFFGPLDDVDRGEDVYSPLYESSEYCASCHEGVVFGVHVYGTYSEWLESPARAAGKQCQSCHAAPTGMTNLAPGRGGLERDPRTLGDHRFHGGHAGTLKKCLKLSIKATKRDGTWLVQAEVLAENVGHRVPTGFIDRHLILAIQGFGDGQVAHLKGPTISSARAGEELSAAAGKIYAKLLTDKEGNVPVPFWRARNDFKDTRLYPGKPDLVEVVFPGNVRELRVRLLYRRFWATVAKEKKWPDNEVVVVDVRLPLSRGELRWKSR